MLDDLTRRDFLKGAGLAIAGLVGAGVARAQDQEAQEKPKEKEEEEPKDPDEPAEEDFDDLFGDEDEETRACPQCGALMYRQGNTWTCETCGYSYVE